MKIFPFFSILLLVATPSWSQETDTSTLQSMEMDTSSAAPSPPQGTGFAAASSADATTSNWQNWVFAGSALVTAATGVVIISTNTGSFNH